MPQEYNLAAFRADLKAVMLRAGVERRPTCLFLEDHQLGDPGFLECINSLLSGGEVSAPCSSSCPLGSASPAHLCFFIGFTSLSSSWGTLSSWSQKSAQLSIRVTSRPALRGPQHEDVVILDLLSGRGEQLCGCAVAGSVNPYAMQCSSCRRLPYCVQQQRAQCQVDSYNYIAVVTLHFCSPWPASTAPTASSAWPQHKLHMSW